MIRYTIYKPISQKSEIKTHSVNHIWVYFVDNVEINSFLKNTNFLENICTWFIKNVDYQYIKWWKKQAACTWVKYWKNNWLLCKLKETWVTCYVNYINKMETDSGLHIPKQVCIVFHTEITGVVSHDKE